MNVKVRKAPIWVVALVFASFNLFSNIVSWSEGHAVTEQEITGIVIWYAIVVFVAFFLEGDVTVASRWKDDPAPKEKPSDSESA